MLDYSVVNKLPEHEHEHWLQGNQSWHTIYDLWVRLKK